eukprot:scaffold24406_cov170-Amphora_coffeaeformis.AAC.2
MFSQNVVGIHPQVCRHNALYDCHAVIVSQQYQKLRLVEAVSALWSCPVWGSLTCSASSRYIPMKKETFSINNKKRRQPINHLHHVSVAVETKYIAPPAVELLLPPTYPDLMQQQHSSSSRTLQWHLDSRVYAPFSSAYMTVSNLASCTENSDPTSDNNNNNNNNEDEQVSPSVVATPQLTSDMYQAWPKDKVVRIVDANTVKLEQQGLVSLAAMQMPSPTSGNFQFPACFDKSPSYKIRQLIPPGTLVRAKMIPSSSSSNGNTKAVLIVNDADGILVNAALLEEPSIVPPNPANDRRRPKCSDFETYEEAYKYYSTFFPYYGDVARLDRDNDGVPCPGLPHTENPDLYRMKVPRDRQGMATRVE